MILFNYILICSTLRRFGVLVRIDGTIFYSLLFSFSPVVATQGKGA